MNLPYAYQLLFAAVDQRDSSIKLRGIQADHEVRLMAQAGLVEASFGDGKEGSFTSIDRVTEMGRTFLRTFKDHPLPLETAPGKSLTASQAAVLAKWKATFDLDSL